MLKERISDAMLNNTVSKVGTHFLRGVELIVEARKQFSVSSENWTYPIMSFGDPIQDHYYAEVWKDGMDWQPNYWLLEQVIPGDPVAILLMIFDKHEDHDRFNEHDFNELLRAILWLRRNKCWIKGDERAHYGDTVWPYVESTSKIHENEFFHECKPFMVGTKFEHASQPVVEFWLNSNLIK